MTKLQKLAAKLKAAQATADKLYDAAFEAADINPESAEFTAAESAWEKADTAANDVREQIAAEIVKMTFGQIDRHTAWRMTYTEKLYDLIARQAG